MNYIYFTDRFKEEVKGTPHEEILFKRVKDLDKYDDTSKLKSVSAFRNNKLIVYKLLKTYNCRVIIQINKIEVEEDEIDFHFVMEYVPKSSFGYKWKNVIHPSLLNGTWLDDNLISNEEIEKAKTEYLAIKYKNDIPKEPPPLELTKWLDKFSSKINFDIFEYEDWVRYSSITTPDGLEAKYVLFFRKLIKTIIKNDTSLYDWNEIKENVYSITNKEEGTAILFSKHKILNRRDPLFVIRDGANIKSQKQRWEEILKKAKEIEVDSEKTLKVISKKAFRAYEKWILNDSENDLWETIQRYNGNHNLSLLPEQIDFLSDFQFPVYINGQAGSGKSTMLYYLYANVFTHKIAGEFEGDIIFLTENKNLLEQTRASILGLLNSNPNFHLDLTVEQKSEIKESFYSFNEFLLKLIPDEEKEKYPAAKFMDFATFKSLYTKKYNNKYSAEEAWFVINTYVLGYEEDEIIDSREKYENLVVNEFRIMDGSTFEDIVKNTFPSFKKLINENKYWTKTTLVREIRKLFPNDLPVNYVSVFCDEAQDFTKIELRLIIHSSEFMKYDLSNEDKIPIVFAGDALQTVSPNRFTMKRLKQMFYNIFIESKFIYSAEIQERTIYTPKFNYRSSEQIVRIANVIQQFRQQFLKEDMYVKQESKRTESKVLNPMLHYKEWLIRDENIDSFENKFKYKSFIIPTDLNEEEIYLKDEKLLSKNQGTINSKTQPVSSFSDIKSSINAKGAEYSQVVVYGFGDYHLKYFGKLNEENNKNDFKLKFFFNKLYVAITRAQNELIIIDSKEGANNFWVPLFEAIQNISEPWESFHDLGDIILINPETLEDVTTSTKEDAFENAKKDMDQGILDGNATRLKVASNTFEILGFEKEANESLGHAELIKENWNKAGECFSKAVKLNLTADAFFKGKIWNKIPKSVEGSIHKGRLIVANLMSIGSWGEEDITHAYDLRDSIYKAINGVNWYSDLSEKLIVFINSVSKQNQKRDLAIIIESIIKESDIHLRKVLAHLYFETSQYEKAISCWENYILDEDVPSFPKNYINSKIEVYEKDGNEIEKLLWLGKLFFISEYRDKNKLTNNANKYLELYNQIDLRNVEDIHLREANEQLFSVYSILGKRDTLHELAKGIEYNQKFLEQILEFYENSLRLTNDKTIANFIKERWIFKKLELIKKEKSLTKVNDSIVNQLNQSYQSKNFPFTENEPIWSEEELQQLGIEPNPISNFPPNHLSNISITNYRKLKKIELTNIGTYNLILGDNNTGKTTLLEALMFSHIPNQQFLNLLSTHNLRKNRSISFIDEGVEIIKESKYNKAELTENIMFDIVSGRQNWSYILRHPSLEEIRDKTKIDNSNPNKYIVLESKISNTEIEFSDPLNLLQQDKGNIPFVPFGKGYSSELTDLYFQLIGHDRKLRKEFYKHLKAFIPDLVEITIKPDTNTIIIEEESKEGAYSENPLYNYGEGANKLFRIIVQIYASRGKRLMIDEIDAGIHFSRFKNFWEVILEIAMNLKVQLFVSTHNEECIRFFHEVLLTEKLDCCRADSRIITLEYLEEEDIIIPIVRDFDNVNYAIEHDLEIRGNE